MTARSIASWRLRLRESRLLIAVEIAVVAAIFVADQHHLIFFSKTPYLLVLGWLSMLLRGVRWHDVGLSLPPRAGLLLLIGIAAGVVMEALELFVTQPLLVQLTGKFPDLSDFNDLIDNWKLLLLFLGLAWVLAALGEELVWRGYVLNRLTDLFGKTAFGWTLALIAMSTAFGFAHYDQGITGIIENTLAGLMLGGLYLATGRNLMVPILAHGITDTIDFLIIFAGCYPGM